MKKYILPIVILFIVIFIGLTLLFFKLNSKNSNSKEEGQISNPPVLSSPGSMEDEDTKEKEIQGGRFVDYDESLLSFAENHNIVLFFYAPWCPSCRTLESNLLKSQSDGELPDNLLILKVDFDSSTSLKSQYGVTLQHTIVQIDSNGNKISLWNGLYAQYTLQDILVRII